MFDNLSRSEADVFMSDVLSQDVLFVYFLRDVGFLYSRKAAQLQSLLLSSRRRGREVGLGEEGSAKNATFLKHLFASLRKSPAKGVPLQVVNQLPGLAKESKQPYRLSSRGPLDPARQKFKPEKLLHLLFEASY